MQRDPSIESATLTPRIVVYGIGQYGQAIVRLATRKGWPIVAAFNRPGRKIGQDVGRLAGLDVDLGVEVQDCEQADYRHLDANIGIVTMTDRIAKNLPAYERLLNAGLNVLCHGGEAIHPFAADPVLATRINDLALTNNVTFTGSGIWDSSRAWSGILAASTCTQITSLFHRSVTNTEGFAKEILLATGTGMTVDEFQQKIAVQNSEMGNLHRLIPYLVLEAIGLTVTKCTERREPVVLDKPFYCKTLGRELEPGLCAGMRGVVDAETRQGITYSGHLEARVLCNPGEVEHMFWSVDGKPSARLTFERDDSSHMSIATLFNRIKDVIAAPPGIQLVTQLSGPARPTYVD